MTQQIEKQMTLLRMEGLPNQVSSSTEVEEGLLNTVYFCTYIVVAVLGGLWGDSQIPNFNLLNGKMAVLYAGEL